jgi:lysophospholipase L1-like esterase
MEPSMRELISVSSTLLFSEPYLMRLLVLLGLVVAAELAARWWLRYRKVYYVFPPGLRLELHLDRNVFPQLEPLVRFAVNRDGERGDEVPGSTSDRKLYRVLVAGGSQPEGYCLDQDASWPGAMQRLLQLPEHASALNAEAVHVGNIARSGVGSEGLDLILQRVLPRYPRLQAIVILVGASDVLRWVEQGTPSKLSPVRPSEVFRCHPEGPFGWTPTTLALTEVIMRLRRRWLRPVHTHERAGAWVGKARSMRARAKEVRTTMPDPSPMLDHFERHFRALLERAKAHADRVLVVRQPWFDKEFTPQEDAQMWHGGVGEAWQEEVTTYYASEVVSRLMSVLDARACRVAEELGIEQLDLMPTLERSLRTYYDFFHLTPAGARAVAFSVAAALLQRPAVRSEDFRKSAGERAA